MVLGSIAIRYGLAPGATGKGAAACAGREIVVIDLKGIFITSPVQLASATERVAIGSAVHSGSLPTVTLGARQLCRPSNLELVRRPVA